MASADSLLAALRRLGRHHGIGTKTSLEFSMAADALASLKHAMVCGHTPPAVEREVVKRTQDVKEGILLHRRLEVDMNIPHRRNLKSMVHLVGETPEVSSGSVAAMHAIVQRSNSARHKRWPHDERQSPAATPTCTRSRSPVKVELMLQRLEEMLAQVPKLPSPARPPGVFYGPGRNTAELLSDNNPFMRVDADHFEQAFEKGFRDRLDKAFSASASDECFVSSGSITPRHEDGLLHDKLVNATDKFYRNDLARAQRAAVKLQSWLRGTWARIQIQCICAAYQNHAIKLVTNTRGEISYDFDDYEDFEQWALT